MRSKKKKEMDKKKLASGGKIQWISTIIAITSQWLIAASQNFDCEYCSKNRWDTNNKTPENFYLPLLASRILHCEDESFVTFGCMPVSNTYKQQKSRNLWFTIICLAESYTVKMLLLVIYKQQSPTIFYLPLFI